MRTLLNTALVTLALGFVGCAARDAEMYRTDTRALLETKNGAISACYNAELKADRKAAGKVVVRFTVQNDTGKIVDAKVDETQSKASPALGKCVVDAINGLTLDPADKRDGDATFSWEFEPQG
ncbi:MAG TPA: AgmX/PglI C-terminal domain-containing protein [Polyangiales bacterium]|jgi:outer membrane biosynthesis protein TonB